MNADEIVRALRGVQQKHANDKLLTFQTDISAMARDCANLIESLQAKLSKAETYLELIEEECCDGHWFDIEGLIEQWRGPQDDVKGDAQ